MFNIPSALLLSLLSANFAAQINSLNDYQEKKSGGDEAIRHLIENNITDYDSAKLVIQAMKRKGSGAVATALTSPAASSPTITSTIVAVEFTEDELEYLINGYEPILLVCEDSERADL